MQYKHTNTKHLLTSHKWGYSKIWSPRYSQTTRWH